MISSYFANKIYSMFQDQRREKILQLIQENGSCRVTELTKIFNVSEPTIRQDLIALEDSGSIVRQHGGAFLRTNKQQFISIADRGHSEEKKRIGRVASSFVEDGDSIFLDSGSTVSEMTELLKTRKNLYIVTNALNIAINLGNESTHKVLVKGGEFKSPTCSCTGEKSLSMFEDIHVDKLFLATGGFSVEGGLSYPSTSDIAIKKAMIEHAKTTYLLADSSKAGKMLLTSLGSLDLVDCIITDDGISVKELEKIKSLGIKVITV